MGVRVHLPLTIRWPGDASGETGPAAEALDLALERGLAAALGRVRDEVFTPRGGYAVPRPRRPTVDWQDPDGEVTADERAAIEARIADAVARALSEHPLTGAVQAPEVLPRAPSEPVDWRRMRGLDYRVHSYDGNPGEAALPADASAAAAAAPQWLNVWWHWDGRDESLRDRLTQHVEDNYTELRPEYIAAIFTGTKNGHRGIWAAHYRVQWSAGGFTSTEWRYEPLLESFRVISREGLEPRHEPPDGVYRLDQIGSYSTAAELRALALAQLPSLAGLPSVAAADETADQSALRRRWEQELERFAQSFGGVSDHLLCRLTTPLNTNYLLVTTRAFFLGRQAVPLDALDAWRRVTPDEGPQGPGGSASGGGGPAGGEGGGEGEAGGEGAGEGADGGESGSPLADPDAAPGTGPSRIYPRINIGGESVTLDLSPFMDEPNVNDLGEAGQALKRLIRRIAYRLEMPEGEYCGSFLIAAAQVIGGRASLVGEAAVAMPRATRQVEPGSGNLGDVEVSPEHTPAIEMLRFIGGTCPLVTRLTRLMSEIYAQPQVCQHHFGRYQGRPYGWLLHFHMEHTPAMERGVGHLYMRACQATMLQVLRSSAEAIHQRLYNFERYFPVFEGLILGLVAQEADLVRMRQTLQARVAEAAPTLETRVAGAVRTWREVRRTLSFSISDQLLNASEIADGPDAGTGTPFQRADASWAIRDGHGRVWTLADLETAIAMRGDAARSIDPLINQLTDLPDAVDIFRNHPQMARVYLYSLLCEMSSSNAEITREVSSNHIYAFRSGKIREDLPNRTVPGTDVALQGIHLLAHQAIGDAFEGDSWYGAGIDWVFTVELGRQALTTFFETGIVIGLSVLCPPLGAAAGLVVAGIHYGDASERLRIGRSVMNPNDLYDRAELELDLFMAELELVLSIIPEIGAIARGASRGANVVGRYGLARGAARLGVEARRQLIRSFARQARQGLARAFVTSIVSDRVMALLMPQVLGPVITAVDAEIRMMTAPRPPAGTAAPPPPAGAAATPQESDARPTSPQGIAFYSRLDEYRPSPDEEVRRPAEDQP